MLLLLLRRLRLDPLLRRPGLGERLRLFRAPALILVPEAPLRRSPLAGSLGTVRLDPLPSLRERSLLRPLVRKERLPPITQVLLPLFVLPEEENLVGRERFRRELENEFRDGEEERKLRLFRCTGERLDALVLDALVLDGCDLRTGVLRALLRVCVLRSAVLRVCILRSAVLRVCILRTLPELRVWVGEERRTGLLRLWGDRETERVTLGLVLRTLPELRD